jgi:CheY-like chemotaxis protein
MSAIKKKLVLVAEDEVLIREFEIATLERVGFEVLSAMNGIEGAALFARHFHEIELIVSDISMPGMTGLELAAFARSVRPDVKIVIASGSTANDDREAAGLIENSRFVAKPFTSTELLDAIAELSRVSATPALVTGMVEHSPVGAARSLF